MNLDEIKTTGEAKQWLSIAKEELSIQRNVFVKPLRKERERVQHLIKCLPEELIGTITVELPMGTITVDDPDDYEELIKILKTYRDRVLHQLDTNEEQYMRQRDRMMRLYRAIEKSEAAAYEAEAEKKTVEKPVVGGS